MIPLKRNLKLESLICQLEILHPKIEAPEQNKNDPSEEKNETDKQNDEEGNKETADN